MTSFVAGIGLGGWAGGIFKNLAEGWIITLGGSWIACTAITGLITFKLYQRDGAHQVQVENDLEDVEAIYRQMIKSSPDGITLTNLRGEITFVSDRIYEIHKADDPKDVIGHQPLEFIAPQDQARALTNIRNVFKDIYTTENTYTLLHKDGTPFSGEIKATLLRGAAGEPVGMMAITRDITERLKTEQDLRDSEKRFRDLFENMIEGYMLCQVTRKDGRITDITYEAVNEAYRKFSVVQNVIGKSFNDIVPDYFEKYSEQVALFERVLSTGQPERYEAHFSEFSQWYSTTVYRGDADHLVLLIEDISERKLAESTLRDREERYRALVEQAADALLVFDSDGCIREVNNRACESTGYTQSELLAMKVSDLDRGYPLAQIQHELAKIVPGKPFIRIGQYTCKDGSTIPVEVYFARMTIKGQALFMGLIHDITERKQAEEAICSLNADLEARVRERTAELTDVYENAPIGSHSVDINGFIIHINNTELKWLGYTHEEVVGIIKFPDLLTDDTLPTFLANFESFKERGWVNGLDFKLKRKDGSIFPVLVNATAIYDSQGCYLRSRSIMLDLTDRQRAEQATKQLYDSQQRHTIEVEQSNQELEAFAYSISHDLRAPLRAINGYAGIVLQDYSSRLDEQGMHYLQAISRNANVMGDEINDLLDLSRVGRTEIHAAEMDMTRLVEKVYDEITSPEVKAAFELILHPLPKAWGDQTLMHHVWSNLISNAVKYTAAMPVRRIEIRGEQVEHRLVYSIQDTGVGFDSAYSQRLFGIFQRLHPTAQFEGTGVGLAIVKRIVNRHGGEVWAESQVDQGATFSFSLPIRE